MTLALPHEFGANDARAMYVVPAESDDKYSRGVVGFVTGSRHFPGSAVLGVSAAHRVGVGMVRYVGPAKVAKGVVRARPETVLVDGVVGAWVVGSGISTSVRSSLVVNRMTEVLGQEAPVIVDAGALDLLTRVEHSGHVIATPHVGELSRLMTDATSHDSPWSRENIVLDPLSAACRAADELGVVVSLKGHVTHVASPVAGDERIVYRVSAPNSWLATAGTGDVLAGSLGALVATSKPSTSAALATCAATASYLNGRAAALASRGGPISAMDVAEGLPDAVRELFE